MEISPAMEILAITLTFVVHVIGAGVLIWGLIDHDDKQRGSWRDWWPKDDKPEPPVSPSAPSAGGLDLPLFPDAVPSPVRLREPGHIGDNRIPVRRPAHPAPAPQRTPERAR